MLSLQTNVELAPRPGLEPGTCGLGIRWSREHGFAGHPLHVTLRCAHAASFISAAIVSHATAIC